VNSANESVAGRLNVRNSHGASITFHLEPWGDEYEMPAHAVFEVVAYGPEGGFEIESGVADVAVWLWSGTTAEVLQDGELVSLPRHGQPPVPPEARLLRNILFPPGDLRANGPSDD